MLQKFSFKLSHSGNDCYFIQKSAFSVKKECPTAVINTRYLFDFSFSLSVWLLFLNMIRVVYFLYKDVLVSKNAFNSSLFACSHSIVISSAFTVFTNFLYKKKKVKKNYVVCHGKLPKRWRFLKKFCICRRYLAVRGGKMFL